MSPDFEAAANGEIDIIFAVDVTPDLLEDLDAWTSIGWLLLECGCLVSPDGAQLHGLMSHEGGDAPTER